MVAPEALIYLSLSAVLIAGVSPIFWNEPNSDVEDATTEDTKTEDNSWRSATKEKEMVKERDIALKQIEKETVEILQNMAVLNASTQLQLANLSLQETAVESDAKVQIAKTNAEKEVRIAELDTKVKLAETDVKLKSEQVKVSKDVENMKMKLEEAKIEMIKLEKDMELKVAKANAEKEIKLAQEAAKILEHLATIKRQENMIELLQVEMAKLKTEAEISRKQQKNEISSTDVAVVVVLSSAIAIAVSSNYGIELLRRGIKAVRGFMTPAVVADGGSVTAVVGDDGSGTAVADGGSVTAVVADDGSGTAVADGGSVTATDDRAVDSQQRKTQKFGVSRRSDTDLSDKKISDTKLSEEEND